MGTRHSAGHTLIEALREELGFPRFDTDRSLSGEVSRGGYDSNLILFKSSSLMNVSGKPVGKAYRQFLKDLDTEERSRAVLVVLHDELEAPLGKLKVKATGSAKGHNGLSSIIESIGTKVFTLPRRSVIRLLTLPGLLQAWNRNQSPSFSGPGRSCQLRLGQDDSRGEEGSCWLGTASHRCSRQDRKVEVNQTFWSPRGGWGLRFIFLL